MQKVMVFDFNGTLFDPATQGLMAGALEVLAAARERGYVLVLLSQAVPTRERLVRELGLTAYFAEVLLVERKSRRLLDELAERLDADVARSVVVGDRALGEVALGRRAGWQTIWLQAGRFAGEGPDVAWPPHDTVHDLREVLALM